MMAGHGRILVGGVQFSGVPGDKSCNCDAAERLIRQAAGQGAQIVVTPECVLTGFVGGTHERQLAEPIPGPCTERFSALARQLGVAILLGQSELRDGQVYNAMSVLWPDGHLRGVMRKVHINKFEIPGGWRNGSAFPVFDLRTSTGACRFGIMICYDRELPESARLLMLQRADIIFNPLACRCMTIDIHRCLLRTRAFENELYIVVVNHAAPAQNGHSLVIDHEGSILAETGEQECVFVHELDIDRLNEYRRSSFYAMHHRRPELYSPLIDPAGQMHPADANLPPVSSARAMDI